MTIKSALRSRVNEISKFGCVCEYVCMYVCMYEKKKSMREWELDIMYFVNKKHWSLHSFVNLLLPWSKACSKSVKDGASMVCLLLPFLL